MFTGAAFFRVGVCSRQNSQIYSRPAKLSIQFIPGVHPFSRQTPGNRVVPDTVYHLKLVCGSVLSGFAGRSIEHKFAVTEPYHGA